MHAENRIAKLLPCHFTETSDKIAYSKYSFSAFSITVTACIFTGAAFLLFLIFFTGLYNADHGQWWLTALQVAQHKLHHSFTETVAVAILCNIKV